MIKKENIKYDEWFSEVINKQVYNFIVTDESIIKDETNDKFENEWLKKIKNEPVFVYSKISTDKIEYIRYLESLGFHLIETNLIFKKPINNSNEKIESSYNIRLANSNDRDGAVDIATNNFIYTRFHVDPEINLNLANKIKGKWVENFFNGKRGDNLVVAENGNKIIGFLQLLSDKKEIFTIDLIAVGKNYRGKKIATNMILFAQNYYNKFKYVKVGTQITNIPSIGLYQKLGFMYDSSNYVFHYHN